MLQNHRRIQKQSINEIIEILDKYFQYDITFFIKTLKEYQNFIEYPEIDKRYHKKIKSCNDAQQNYNNDLLPSEFKK